MIKVNFIEPSHEFNIIPNPNDGNEIIKFIEKIGRVCYKSEEKITDNSARKFVKIIFDKGHTTVFGNYIFNFEVSKKVYNHLLEPSLYSEYYRELLAYIRFSNYNDKYYVSGSFRAFNQLAKYIFENEGLNTGNFLKVYQLIKNLLPPDITYDPDILSTFLYVPNEEVKLLTLDDINKLPYEIRRKHNWFSVHITTSRSVTHELVRHQKLTTYNQESTRYVNYKDKGYYSILPYWMSNEIKSLIMNNDKDPEKWKVLDPDNVIAAKAWVVDIIDSFSRYEWFLNLDNQNYSPQDIKDKLYHATKAEIHVTTYEDEWDYIFNMRCIRGAYPGIRETMCPILQDVSKISFNEFKYNENHYANLIDDIINNGGTKYFEIDSTTVPIYHASTTDS